MKTGHSSIILWKNNMEIVTSALGNSYIYEQRTGYISLVPGSYMSKNNPASYYSEKIKYLTRFGLISDDSKSEFKYKLLETEDIKDALINTHQIIFEVTDKCNLDCYYCGYGHFYENHDLRKNQDMSFDAFKTLYNYLDEIWEKNNYKGCTYLRISFYGGEPLCNFPFIKKAVEYVTNNPIKNKRIVYSMTTNAVLLDRYMDFLVDNNFEILISLDGDKYNDSYRIFKNGRSSFDTVISNVDKLHQYYPDFFTRNVKFNSVLHNRNSVKDANSFIFKRYQKYPMTNELNVFGIAESKRAEFRKMFHSKTKEFSLMTTDERKEYESQSPFMHNCEKWVFNTLMKAYSLSLLDALSENYAVPSKTNLGIPTQTCIPFSRKIFVSVDGRLFPCERIGNEFDFGKIHDGNVEINFEGILCRYNQLFTKYINICKKCKAKDFCSVCVVSDINGYEVCSKTRPRNIKEFISFFEMNPNILQDIIKTVSII